jgi:hypothetical protein
MANRVAALLTQMFHFGVERGILDASPIVALPRPAHTTLLRLALKLVLVTAHRPGEVAEATRCTSRRS